MGPRSVGPFQLERKLGQGGMGEVWLGRSRAGRAVAVKLVHRHLADDPAFRERFAREIEAARRVGGLYTAPLVDSDPAAAQPWMATAYVAGPTLRERVEGGGPLEGDELTTLLAQLAEGLASVHRGRIVHRDLKPSNIILADDGVRLIDFGVARALDGTQHSQTAVAGTRGYMSPEQLRGERIGTAADVFSLGCVACYAATGRTPFGGGSLEEIVLRTLTEEPDLTGLPQPLAPLTAAMLTKDPARRIPLRQVMDALDGQDAPPEPDGGSTATQPHEGTWSDTRSPTGPGSRRSARRRALALIGVLLLLGVAALSFDVFGPGNAKGTHASGSDGHGPSGRPSGNGGTPGGSPHTTAPDTSPAPVPTKTGDPPSALPLSVPGLLSSAFKDAGGAEFLQSYSATHDCSQASATALIGRQFAANGCTTMMTGDYLEQTRTTGGDSPILVSVEVIPFPTTADANRAYGLLYGSDYPTTLWCPPQGVGHRPCAERGAINWKKEAAGVVRHHDNYLVMAVALRTDHSSAPAVWSAIVHATWAGAYAVGPTGARGGSGELVSWS
ncbi:serine/threonine-protein kinase [Actinacidiphila acidipaludis]|uniref:Serine/threonine protein kinase n=1 Tax=Actinacidiphila acidipaludis TaxID=2873382 RepID=A0ABS7Q2E9_9ACTN|nr:serine/threonine-protein kinase [Streptomyces acidipaludis]MBY8877295.1 serine/threonine protein kinase [Streptomyces acidipaludis]